MRRLAFNGGHKSRISLYAAAALAPPKRFLLINYLPHLGLVFPHWCQPLCGLFDVNNSRSLKVKEGEGSTAFFVILINILFD